MPLPMLCASARLQCQAASHAMTAVRAKIRTVYNECCSHCTQCHTQALVCAIPGTGQSTRTCNRFSLGIASNILLHNFDICQLECRVLRRGLSPVPAQ